MSALDQNKKVLWLVPGGSAISIVAEISKRLAGRDLGNLSVTLTDERYGEVGHPDSNWKQLADLNFDLPGANLVPVLNGKDRAGTTADFAEALTTLLDQSDYALGFFGIGPDGHTAGILPGSPAVTSTMAAQDYDAGNFQRITMTPLAIEKLDEVVVYAMGEAKWPVFDQLETDVPVNEQPAQFLKQVPTVTIFNDYKGEV
jgi:6-phosphogluconolactonase/glucosamine-6-phosphate isomerase/deaminase